MPRRCVDLLLTAEEALCLEHIEPSNRASRPIQIVIGIKIVPGEHPRIAKRCDDPCIEPEIVESLRVIHGNLSAEKPVAASVVAIRSQVRLVSGILMGRFADLVGNPALVIIYGNLKRAVEQQGIESDIDFFALFHPQIGVVAAGSHYGRIVGGFLIPGESR